MPFFAIFIREACEISCLSLLMKKLRKKSYIFTLIFFNHIRPHIRCGRRTTWLIAKITTYKMPIEYLFIFTENNPHSNRLIYIIHLINSINPSTKNPE